MVCKLPVHGPAQDQVLRIIDRQPKVRTAHDGRRLKDLNPRLEIEAVGENVSEANAARLVEKVDLVVGAAPLFEERFLMNREAVRQGKPLVDCAMYDLDAQVTTVLPGRSPCLACLYPKKPSAWKREFPVLGAVAGTAGSIGAVEAVKVLIGLGKPLAGRLLSCDLRSMAFRTIKLSRRTDCGVCGSA